MKAEIELQHPKEISASITITMTVRQWIELDKALTIDNYYGPAGQLRGTINSLVRKVNTLLQIEDEEESHPSE